MQEIMGTSVMSINEDIYLQTGIAAASYADPSYWDVIGVGIASLLSSTSSAFFNISIFGASMILFASLILFVTLLLRNWITPFFHGYYSLKELNRSESVWRRSALDALKKRLPDAFLGCSLMSSLSVFTFSAFTFFRILSKIFWADEVILATALCPIYCVTCIAFAVFLKSSANGKFTAGTLVAAILEVALAFCVGTVFMDYCRHIGIVRYIFGAVSTVVAVVIGVLAARSVEHGYRKWAIVLLGISTVFRSYSDQAILITNHRTDVTKRLKFNTPGRPPNIFLEPRRSSSREFLRSANKGVPLSGVRRSQGSEIELKGHFRKRFEPVTYTSDDGDFSWFIMKESWILQMWRYVGLDFGSPSLNFDWIVALIILRGGHIRAEGDVLVGPFYSWQRGIMDVICRTRDQRCLHGDGSWSQATKGAVKIAKGWTSNGAKTGDLQMHIAIEFNILVYDFQVLIWNILGAAKGKHEAVSCYELIRRRIGVVMSYAKELCMLNCPEDALFWEEIARGLSKKIGHCLDTKDCTPCQEYSNKLNEGKKRLDAWMSMKYHPINGLYEILLSPEFDFQDEAMAQGATSEQVKAHTCSNLIELTSIVQNSRADIGDWKKKTGQDDINTIIAQMDKETKILVSDIKRLAAEPSGMDPFRARYGAVNIGMLDGYVALYDRGMKPSSWDSSDPIKLAQGVECFVIGHTKLFEAINYSTVFDNT